MNKNNLLDLALDLKEGEISLKDLYLDQLLADNSEDGRRSLEALLADVEADEEYYVAPKAGKTVPTVSFDFTKSVMKSVRQHAATQEVKVAKPQTSFINNIIANPAAIPAMAGAGANGAGSEFNLQNQLFSSNLETDNSTNDEGGNSGNKSRFFNQNNLFTAAFAFLATIISVFVYNAFSSNSDNDFNTLANNTTVQQIDYKNLSTAQKTIVASNSAISDIKAKEVLASQNITTFKLYSGYQPVPLSEGIKYVSLSVAKPVQNSGITLKPLQSTNLQILLSNYEIQRRLIGNKKR